MSSVAPSPTPREERRTGTVLGGRYSLQRRIALGGMGEVWAATDNVLGRQVAVKILREELVDSPSFLARFRAEARHTAALAHPGIASVFDYGEDQVGERCVAYLVMELVPGTPLSKVMAERVTLPLDMALSLLSQTAQALHAAHLMGVIHRDVKPGNLLLLDDGTIKVTDFGIAHATSSGALTDVGQVLGTARYMSPEQATGTEVTPASDVYSLGVIGYEMLAGSPPFTADNPAALAMAHVHQAPPPLAATLPAGVRAAIGEALSKDPTDRPRDAQAFARRLDKLRTTTSPAWGGQPGETNGTDAPTRVMVYSDGSRTAIMPAHAIVAHDPNHAQSDSNDAHRLRRWIAVAALAAVILLVGLAQFGGVDGSDLVSQAKPATVPATTATTAPAAISTTSATPTSVAVGSTQPGKGNGNGHGNSHKPKD